MERTGNTVLKAKPVLLALGRIVATQQFTRYNWRV